MKHVVGLSGGIDSQATALWTRNRYRAEDVILLNSQAGRWEHELTVEHVAEYSRTIHPVIECVPIVSDIWETDDWAEVKRGLDGSQELTMELLISIKKRPPSRKAKFCTEILKLRPQRRWMREAFGPTGIYAGEEYVRYSGVRRDESLSRQDVPFSQWDDFFDCILECPLADWSKQMCFDYVMAQGEAINPLYSMGCDRIGCMPCIESGKDEVFNISERFPEHIEKVRGVEERTGKTFFMPKFRGQPNTIDEVVEWSRTDRGGQQFNILKGLDTPSCSSKYGLCG